MLRRLLGISTTSPESSSDGTDADGELGASVGRRTYLKGAGGIATVGLGKESGDGSPFEVGSLGPGTQMNEPTVRGYGGTTLSDGGSTVVRAAEERTGTVTRPQGGRSELATPLSLGKQVQADLDSDAGDWYVVDAERNDPIHVEYDRLTDVGNVALFLYGPDGRLEESLSADTAGERELLGVADRSGSHFLQAVDVTGDEEQYSFSLQTGDSRNFGSLSTGGQSPYGGTAQSVPGTIQAQKFDEGGEGVAYSDSNGSNSGGAFRPDSGVDIESTADATGEYNVGWIKGGEWLEFTVDASPGTYDLHARVASNSGGKFEVSLDGTTLGTVEVPDTGGWQNWQTVTIKDVDVSTDGSGILRFDALTRGFNLNWLRFTGQSPYGGTPQTVPGTIQAQEFDEGGEGIAYSDTTSSNDGGAFRPDSGVDIESTADATGEYNVGYIKGGEWLEFTVDASSNTYDLNARVASNSGGKFEVSLDGTTLGTVEVPDTGGWQNWQTVTIKDVDVSTDGSGILRIDALTDGVNLNYLEFLGQRPYGGSARTIPGKVEAEEFDEGGQGVAYSDSNGSNSGGAFRPDSGVDIESAADGSNEYNVGWIKGGEWLEFTVDASSGTYDLNARVASNSGGKFEVSLDGTTLGTVEVPDTGGWQSWQTVTLTGVDVPTSGTGVLRFDALTGGYNLNWLEFASSSSTDAYGDEGYGADGYGN